MPIIKITTLPSGSMLGLWRISETIDDLLRLYPSLSSLYMSVRQLGSKSRIVEKMCVQALLVEMTGKQDISISHNSDGRPFLEGWYISISHSKGFASVILSKENEVAIDIEYISDRVSKIANRFIRKDEQCMSLIQQLITWCVKETIYKYYSSQHLGFFDIRLHDICSSSFGTVCVDNLKTHSVVDVNYVVASDYVLTYID